MLYDIKPSEVLTADKQNMTVDSYLLWKVDNPSFSTKPWAASRQRSSVWTRSPTMP